jgi:hypothetical protein
LIDVTTLFAATVVTVADGADAAPVLVLFVAGVAARIALPHHSTTIECQRAVPANGADTCSVYGEFRTVVVKIFAPQWLAVESEASVRHVCATLVFVGVPGTRDASSVIVLTTMMSPLAGVNAGLVSVEVSEAAESISNLFSSTGGIDPAPSG